MIDKVEDLETTVVKGTILFSNINKIRIDDMRDSYHNRSNDRGYSGDMYQEKYRNDTNDNFYKEAPKKKNSQKSVKFEEQDEFGGGDDFDDFDDAFD